MNSIVKIPTIIKDVLGHTCFRVYQARDGAWHGHVLNVGFHELRDLRMRSASMSAHYIALRMEKDAKLIAEEHPEIPDAYKEAIGQFLREQISTYSISSTNGWADVGFCSSEKEARDRCCAVMGHIFGVRLGAQLRPYTPQPVQVAAPREVSFS